EYDGLMFGQFQYHAIPFYKNRYVKHVCQVVQTIMLGLRCHRRRKLDYIHSYDPLMLGFAAVILKILTGAKLIVEVNGHLKKDGFLDRKGLAASVKRTAFSFLASLSLKRAAVIKFLNDEQKVEWQEFLKDQKIVLYHDFVPTHVFKSGQTAEEPYIFFIGYPFYRKAVDILIAAFLEMAEEFPAVKLKIVGHCPGGDAERQKYIDMAKGHPRVEILKPVYFDEAIRLFEQCRFFVLPSRSEAMGRVLIEAMACSKAVIGSRVGGIPGLVRDGENGFLVESENVQQLAEKMKVLLSEENLCAKMGQSGKAFVEENFSSQKYVEFFLDMLRDADHG
ncbi:MAG: glycosyltransferase family 4 protein, partial [Candidatus Omnitrophica bacterium]|nr:glycosyltransferase family 4 protein [Candidatus Omnitrophota bacterium]